MEIKALNCNNCGAQLDVPDVANFATCGHCGSRLAIHHTNSASYTEKIAQLTETTTDVARQVARLAYINKLDRIDKQWEEEQAQYVSQQRNGSRLSPRDKMFTTVAIGILGALVLLMGLSKNNWLLGALGLLLIACGCYGFWGAKVAHQNYELAHQAYVQRRAKVRVEDFMPEPQQES